MDNKIYIIYEIIADKTLSFGCKVKDGYFVLSNIEGRKNGVLSNKRGGKDDYLSGFKKDNHSHNQIIGHPVMIGDLLDWLYVNDLLIKIACNSIVIYNILELWKYKRKPIEEQSQECIDLVFDLVFKLKAGNKK